MQKHNAKLTPLNYFKILTIGSMKTSLAYRPNQSFERDAAKARRPSTLR